MCLICQNPALLAGIPSAAMAVRVAVLRLRGTPAPDDSAAWERAAAGLPACAPPPAAER
ncbi:MAG: hypothetical protein MUE51_13895 [Thermoleophilia bacterium]|jgi:hypothetical protein|nr:hypothetical protein [Thermoleophilia bacterium]